MEDLRTPALLRGFVLSLRPSEVLLTFPELLDLPEGLESEARATVRYSNSSGRFAAVGHVIRVAAGPPVTLTLKRLAPARLDGDETAQLQERQPTPTPELARLPVTLHVVSSRVAQPGGPNGVEASVYDLSEGGLVVLTSILLAVGDTLRLEIGDGAKSESTQGRVVRVFESDSRGPAQFGVGIELVHAPGEAQQRWRGFVDRWRRCARP